MLCVWVGEVYGSGPLCRQSAQGRMQDDPFSLCRLLCHVVGGEEPLGSLGMSAVQLACYMQPLCPGSAVPAPAGLPEITASCMYCDFVSDKNT